MPSRIIRESICSSPTLALLSAGAERLMYRIMVRSDDFGRFLADPAVVRGECIPLLGATDYDLVSWLRELREVGAVDYYEIGGRVYGQFVNWKKYNKTRAKASKYPARKHVQTSANTCKHMLDYSESESESESDSNSECSPALPGHTLDAVRRLLLLPVAELISKSVLSWNPRYSPSRLKKISCDKSLAVLDKLERLDGVSVHRQLAVARWLPTHKGSGNFTWSANIRSASKFREKWDQLEGAMRIDPNTPSTPSAELSCLKESMGL
ncbi:MAG: hypothetical protein V3W44_09755 [Dehalococcoidales bacterium]